MLNNIPKNLSPELVKVLMEMGHGDEILLADAHFPSEALGKRVIRYDSSDIPSLLKSILELMPLDYYSDYQYLLMEVVKGDSVSPSIWNKYNNLMVDSNFDAKFERIERFAFYEQSKRAYAIVATGEKAQYANIILKKGIVK